MDGERKEIERRFLVRSGEWKTTGAGTPFRQAYLCTEPERTVRVRLEGDRGKLTIKGKKVGAAAPEFEYEIPAVDARYILEHLRQTHVVEKTRYRIRHQGRTWEVDEFHGANEGLVIAEVELESEDEILSKPPWIGKEITGDFRYSNSSLSEHPYGEWKDSGP